MAFKGLRFAGLEWKNLTSSWLMKGAVVVMACVPLLYGALYLTAFMDPYSEIDKIAVAVVNEDEGAVLNDEQRNVGDSVVEALEDSDSGLDWHFVSAEEAQEGLEDGTYYMTCTIPSDFTENIASAQTDDPSKAQLQVVYNESENMIATQIGSSAWSTVAAEMSNTVSEEFWNAVLEAVVESGDGLQTAADGAYELQDGLVSAQDGSQTITDNLGTLADGATSLQDGLGTLTTGISSLQTGTSSLTAGATTLSEAASQVASGAGQLANMTSALPDSDQVSTISAASDSLSGGMSSLQSSAEQLSAGAASLQGSLGNLASGAQGVTSAQDAAQQCYQQAAEAYRSGDTATGDAYYAQAEEYMGTAQSLASSVSSGIGASSDGSASGTVYGGVNALAAGLGSAGDTGSSTLIGGLSTVSSGYSSFSTQVLALVEQCPALSTAIQQLSSGATQVADNMPSLVSGSSQLESGAAQLASGSESAEDGADQIADGATQLQDGSASLTDGLGSAVDGAGELGDGLADGAQESLEQAGNTEAKAAVMSDPVELDESYYTEVKNYGTGFAPYFLTMALWVGCLMGGFLFKPLNRRLIVSGANPFTVAMAGYLPMMALAVLQATILMLVMQFALNLQIDNVPLFWAMGYLMALSFAALFQFLGASMGLLGKLIAMVLLMLQLTSAGGTFPVELTPPFFQAISPFLPMTHTVEALRQIMAGVDYAVVGTTAVYLAALGVASFVLTCIVAYRKRTVRMDDLHPVLQLDV